MFKASSHMFEQEAKDTKFYDKKKDQDSDSDDSIEIQPEELEVKTQEFSKLKRTPRFGIGTEECGSFEGQTVFTDQLGYCFAID
ncbi:MAG: hypothetical protein EZS28_009662 [Streblomastix strix]|uniref:Uncharacterized protein n=1 Tax=Streblomastix strix TaxID=222440 RepID=A0A5J4WIT4_9EUKA|nr:MAG: hypothetical protein EZS28_009662 [Streblomastix strix]